MQFTDEIAFCYVRSIGEIDGASMIVGEMYCHQTMWGMWNGFNAPDYKREPLPERPEQQEPARPPGACAKGEFPSQADGAPLLTLSVLSAGFLFNFARDQGFMPFFMLFDANAGSTFLIDGNTGHSPTFIAHFEYEDRFQQL